MAGAHLLGADLMLRPHSSLSSGSAVVLPPTEGDDMAARMALIVFDGSRRKRKKHQDGCSSTSSASGSTPEPDGMIALRIPNNISFQQTPMAHSVSSLEGVVQDYDWQLCLAATTDSIVGPSSKLPVNSERDCIEPK